MSANGTRKYNGAEPIAIIGSGFRFPGSASDPSKLWELLRNPRDVLRPISKDRFNTESFYHPNPSHHGTFNVKNSYLLDEDPRHFDAGFFNIKPVEVPAMDPQQRLLMETIYESLESAGIAVESLAGSQTGVYVGAMSADYAEILNHDLNAMPTYTPTGTARSIMSNRISYFFDWHGPSMTIDTACSSSLVAVHQAVQLLRSGDSDVAIAAGANLILGPLGFIGISKLNMLSGDSRSRMWDADASGYARGEGVAALVLKRLSTAIADGDTIESIIRETGVNQDGRTKGITMPSQVAQASLIAKTYAKAGLDPKNPRDRCQYFEAHGTGTAAGDPREAEAISIAFFNPGQRLTEEEDPLYVGSIKTVIGHTEGTAGIAGLLKASLALQHGIIPPNLLFNNLSEAVAPYYQNLEIVKEARPWPSLEEGNCRRASCNSFGFGGTNAHAILENYVPAATEDSTISAPSQVVPFVFSAASQKSLAGIIREYSQYLRLHPDLNLSDLAYTLASRKTAHPIKVSISAASIEELCSKIDTLIQPSEGSQAIGIQSRTLDAPARVLGIFTGQGAQWATMGKELIENSPYALKVVQNLDAVLQTLHEAVRPNWSLLGELTCDAADSRLDSAIVAQPLCTVVQIILCDILQSAGVEWNAVVGHSSGEIAAAYAAGHISQEEAVKIAYYRGNPGKHTTVESPGGMIAVGTSFEDADKLCQSPTFQGRLCVAAINSSTSITLSGDRDAIEQAEELYKEQNKFARILKVDKAYHSTHMLPISAVYLAELDSCEIQPKSSANGVKWISSTFENRVMSNDEDIRGAYWRENMIRPVLFMQAVQGAVAAEGPFDVVIEVGPHVTLKSLVVQILKETQKDIAPYTGLLHRGVGDNKAISDAFGYLWTQCSPSIVNLQSYDSLLSDGQRRRFVKGLPLYHWDHEKLYWHETRATKAHYLQPHAPNPLLGVRTINAMEQEIRWKNLIRPNELPWIHGHQVEGQLIYPATAYLSTAVEAAIALASGESIMSIEIEDFVIEKPIIFENSDTGVETVFTLSNITRDREHSYSASFIYHACNNINVAQLVTHASGRLIITTGETSPQLLPTIIDDPPNLVDVPEDRFYGALEELGYNYSGDFRALSCIRRKLDFSKASILIPPQDDNGLEPFLLHPALLDSALQGLVAAYCWPGDGSLDQLHVPTGIARIRINVGLCKENLVPGTKVVSASYLTENPLTTKNLQGDVDIFNADGTGLIQMEGVRVVAFAEPAASSDYAVFSEPIWGVAFPDCELAIQGVKASTEDYELAYALERVSIHYMQDLVALFPRDTRKVMNLEWHHERLFEYFEHVLNGVQAGTRQFSEKEWLDDSAEEIAALKTKFEHSIDMRIGCAVGDNLAAVVRGETTILEHMTKDDLLYRYYETGLGLEQLASMFANTVKQIVHRYSQLNILEIGAGTGGTTKRVIQAIGQTFASYTYTDISTGFFENAQEYFENVGDKMIFRTLDIEKDVTEQGYQAQSYDLVIASNVIHATKSLEQSLRNARQLLKPGGYLVIQEPLDNDVVRNAFNSSGLPGWWLGESDGRRLSPCVSSTEWHKLLVKNGFSGVDSSTPESDGSPFPFTIIVSQAIDDRIIALREPLSSKGEWVGETDLVLIGGQSSKTIPLIEEITWIAQSLGLNITVFSSLGDIDTTQLSSQSVVLCLTELDAPAFHNLTNNVLDGMKKLFETERIVLWITQGCRSEEPYMNMSVGLGRTMMLENPDLMLQFLDLEKTVKPDPHMILEALIRLRLGHNYEKQGLLESMLWTNEHEIAYENGKMNISRIYHIKEYNDRYNASRRTIINTEKPEEVPLSLSVDSSKYTLSHDVGVAERMLDREGIYSTSEILIRVSHSILTPIIATPNSQLTLVFGINTTTNNPVVAFAKNNGSFVITPKEWATDIDLPPGSETRFLAQINTQFEVANIISILPRNSNIIIHEPSLELATAIQASTSGGNTNVSFTTTTPSLVQQPWIKVDACYTKRVINSKLPPNVSLFIDNSSSIYEKRVASLVASCLSTTCFQTTVAAMRSTQYHHDPSDTFFSHQLAIMKQKSLEMTVNDASIPHASQIMVGDLIKGSHLTEATSMAVDWKAPSGIPVQIQSVETMVNFKSDKTYVLFGLTSDLAQSLCDWMASHGARNIVLTSRSPKVNSQWVDSFKNRGVRLEVIANDITNRESVTALVSRLRLEFPPIAGIAHGAMVLNDTSFFDMSLDKMHQVIRPKVEGAIILDELFQINSLDFFVFLSSITSVAGNRGQSAYAAANMFMTSLAKQRRDKGLAASVLHICAVLGVGYLSRVRADPIFDALRKTGYLRMSERWLRLCFAEAILASNPIYGRNPEIITGLDTAGLKGTVLARFPRFSHCCRSEDVGNVTLQKRTNAIPTKVKLAEALTEDQILDIVQDAFFVKLQVALQLPADSNKSQILKSGTEELGLDSLVAVEIRSWFLKELEIEIPVIKILSGGSVAQLLQYGLDKMPARLTPKLNGGVADVPAAPIAVKPAVSLPSGSQSDSDARSITKDSSDDEIASSATTPQLIDSDHALQVPVDKIASLVSVVPVFAP